MTWCYKISAKGNFSKEIFFMSLWVVAFGKSWTLKYKFNPLMFIWHTSLFSALYIFRKSWREKSYKKQEKIKSMELVGSSVIQHTVLKITFLKSICSTCGAPGTHLRSTLPGDCPNPLHRSRANMWRTVITFSTESSKSTRSTLQIHYSSYKNPLETDLV